MTAIASKTHKSEFSAEAEFSFTPWDSWESYFYKNWLLIKDFQISLKTNWFKMTYTAFLEISFKTEKDPMKNQTLRYIVFKKIVENQSLIRSKNVIFIKITYPW